MLNASVNVIGVLIGVAVLAATLRIATRRLVATHPRLVPLLAPAGAVLVLVITATSTAVTGWGNVWIGVDVGLQGFIFLAYLLLGTIQAGKELHAQRSSDPN